MEGPEEKRPPIASKSSAIVYSETRERTRIQACRKRAQEAEDMATNKRKHPQTTKESRVVSN